MNDNKSKAICPKCEIEHIDDPYRHYLCADCRNSLKPKPKYKKTIKAPKKPLNLKKRKGKKKRYPKRPNLLKSRFEILKRDKFRCIYCGRSPVEDQGVKLVIDHITPRNSGGSDNPKNLICACWECNIGKSKNSLDVLLEERIRTKIAEKQ